MKIVTVRTATKNKQKTVVVVGNINLQPSVTLFTYELISMLSKGKLVATHLDKYKGNLVKVNSRAFSLEEELLIEIIRSEPLLKKIYDKYELDYGTKPNKIVLKSKQKKELNIRLTDKI